jgi:hypothetical protein
VWGGVEWVILDVGFHEVAPYGTTGLVLDVFLVCICFQFVYHNEPSWTVIGEGVFIPPLFERGLVPMNFIVVGFGPSVGVGEVTGSGQGLWSARQGSVRMQCPDWMDIERRCPEGWGCKSRREFLGSTRADLSGVEIEYDVHRGSGRVLVPRKAGSRGEGRFGRVSVCHVSMQACTTGQCANNSLFGEGFAGKRCAISKLGCAVHQDL